MGWLQRTQEFAQRGSALSCDGTEISALATPPAPYSPLGAQGRSLLVALRAAPVGWACVLWGHVPLPVGAGGSGVLTPEAVLSWGWEDLCLELTPLPRWTAEARRAEQSRGGGRWALPKCSREPVHCHFIQRFQVLQDPS